MENESDYESAQPEPTFTPRPILDPESHVEIYSDYIRVQNSSLLLFIKPDLVSTLPPIHRQQLIQLQTSYDNKGYFSRSDFTNLISLFNRYADTFREQNSHDVEFITNFNRALLESTNFENRIQQLLKIQQESAAKGEKGNYTVIPLQSGDEIPKNPILSFPQSL